MKIDSIPPKILAANQQVSARLQHANELTVTAQRSFRDEPISSARPAAEAALNAATHARTGVDELGRASLLGAAFDRHSNHAVRHLTDAVSILNRSGPMAQDTRDRVTRLLFDAEVSTRVGQLAVSGNLHGSSSSVDDRPIRIGGAWIDSLGNPARGGHDGTWAGPDGTRYDWDGREPRGSGPGSHTGPDGTGYSGI